MPYFPTSLDPSGEPNRAARRDSSHDNNASNQRKSTYLTRHLLNEPSLSSSEIVEISISKLNDVCTGDSSGRRRSTSAKKCTRQRKNSKKKQVFDMSVSSLEIDLDTEDEIDSRFSDGVTKFGTIDLIPTKPKSWNPKRSAGWADWTDEESQRLSQSTHHSRSRRARERGSRTRESKPTKSRSHKQRKIAPSNENDKPQSLKDLRWSSSSNHAKSERNRSSVKESSSRCAPGPSSDKAGLVSPQQVKTTKSSSKDGTSSNAGTRPRHRSRSASRRKQLVDAGRQDSRWGVENTSNHSQGSAAPMDRVPSSPRRKNTLRVPRKGIRAPAPLLST